MVEQGVLLLLLRVINEFADKNLTITSLKVVSNIALVSSSTCDAILNYSGYNCRFIRLNMHMVVLNYANFI
jgi:hypothetical protein